MMKITTLFLAISTLALHAQTNLTWYWTASQGGTNIGSGEFVTASTYDGYAVPGTTWASKSNSGTVPFYAITSVSGEFNGLAISGVLTNGTDGESGFLFIAPNLWTNNVKGFNMDSGGVAFYLNGNTNSWVDLYSYQNNGAIDDNSEGTGNLITYNDATTIITVSDVQPVPEPSVLALFAAGGFGGWTLFRRRAGR